MVERVVERVVEKEKIVYRDRETGAVRLGGSDVAASGSDKGDKKIGKSGKAKDADKIGAGAETAEEKKRRLLEQLGMGGTGADPTLVGGGSSAHDTGAGGGDGQGLSQKDFSNVVGKNKGGLQVCYEQALKKGEVPEDRDVKVLVKLAVGGSGMVKSAVVAGSGAQYPGLKSCIEKSAKKWIFPASSGESAAEFPFLFTPK